MKVGREIKVLYAYPGDLIVSLHRKGIKHTSLQSEVFEKNYEETICNDEGGK